MNHDERQKGNYERRLSPLIRYPPCAIGQGSERRQFDAATELFHGSQRRGDISKRFAW